MRQPQVLVFERDGRLADMVRAVQAQRATCWTIAECRTVESCLGQLRHGGVLVVKLGRDVESEMMLIEQATWLFPEAAVVAVGDVDNPALAGLATDLGAAFVLAPPLSRELLGDLVAGLLQPLGEAHA
jgi:2-keto-3-deoxy-6-phosphogluconate aldolase